MRRVRDYSHQSGPPTRTTEGSCLKKLANMGAITTEAESPLQRSRRQSRRQSGWLIKQRKKAAGMEGAGRQAEIKQTDKAKTTSDGNRTGRNGQEPATTAIPTVLPKVYKI